MSSVSVFKRIAAMGAELEALLAEPLDAADHRVTDWQRRMSGRRWSGARRRWTHRFIAGLVEVPDG